MSFLGHLFRRQRKGPSDAPPTQAEVARADLPAGAIQFEIEKCPVPIIWLDTSVLLNLAMLKLGTLNDTIQVNRMSHLKQHICKLMNEGKLLCPQAGQADEVWARRSDFLNALHELSLGITTRPKAAIEDAQTLRLMTAFITGARSVRFSYTDAFIDDPLSSYAETLGSDYFVTVDGGLAGAVEQIQSQRNSIHQQWEELRKRCVAQGVNFEQQLQEERVGWINAITSMALDCVIKAENGKEPTESERWALSAVGRLISTWDRLGGKPKGYEGLIRFLNSAYYKIIPVHDISSNLVAQLMVGARTIDHGDAMDVEHVSSMLPYANLMVLDRSMRAIVRGLGLDKKYGTTVCYIGDDEEITAFLQDVEKSVEPVSPFPSFRGRQKPV